METTGEEPTGDAKPAERPTPEEKAPGLPESTVREFEEFLLEIGLRI